MKRRILAFALVLAMILLLGIPASALVIEISQADYVENLHTAESFIEVTIKSVSKFVYPKLGEGEEIWNEDYDPYDVKVSVDKNIYGEKITEKQLDLIIWSPYGKEIETGGKYIFALRKNDESERKRLRESNSVYDFDPGVYSASGELRINEEGTLSGLAAVNNIYFESVENMIEQVEGRTPSDDDAEFYGVTPCMYYSGQLIVRAYCTNTVTVYQKRDTKSKKLLHLQPYDFVLQVGETDYISGESWEKILLADGNLGYLSPGNLRKRPYSVNKDSNTLVAISNTMALKNTVGKDLPVGRLVKGTAAVLRDNGPWREDLKGRFLAMSTGMQHHALVDKWDFVRMGRPVGLKLTAGTHDFAAEEEDEIFYDDDYYDVPDGSCRMNKATQTMNLYAQPSTKSDKIGKIPKNAYFMQTDVTQTIKKEGKQWIQIRMGFDTVYAQKSGFSAYSPIETSTAQIYEAEKSVYLCRFDDIDFKVDKSASVYEGFTVMTNEKAIVNGHVYYKISGNDKDALWIRDSRR